MELNVLKEKGFAPSWLTEDGLTTLRGGYMLEGETPKDMWRRVSSAAASRLKKPELEDKFFNLFWNNWLCGASPVLSNMGTTRGLNISCNSLHCHDSVSSLFMKQHELAMLSKNGAGVGIYMGDIRGRNAPIAGNGKSEGVIPWLKCFDSTTIAVSQGCFSDDTEILTEKGWILFKDLPRPGQLKVAQITKDEKIEFVHYSDYIEYHTNEELYHFSCFPFLDIMVTGNHNMVIKNKELEFVRADEIQSKEILMQNLHEGSSVPFRAFPTMLFPRFFEKDISKSKLEDISLTNVTLEKVKYSGNVYCVTVPSNMIMVRRRGSLAQFPLCIGNSTRRGASAVYLPADHTDIEEFISLRRATGDVNRRCQNLHHGVCADDNFMNKVVSGDSDARHTWKEIIKTRFETGEPYLFFTDNVNRQAPECYKKLGLKIKTSNICVTGDQRVVSSEGMKTVKELYQSGQELTLFNGEKPVQASPMRLIEKDAKVFKISTKEGRSHSITEHHKILTRHGMVECKDLKVGDGAIIQRKEGLFGTIHEPEKAFYLGLHQSQSIENNLIPKWLWSGDKETQNAYLKGLFENNNHFYKENVSLSGVTHMSIDFLKNIQIMLSNFGTNSEIFYEDDKLGSLDIALNIELYDTITSIEQIENQDVYCTTVYDDSHLWVCNSFITSNCNEIYLYTDPDHTFVCCLSSMNLARYHEWKDTNAVRLATWFLDAIIEEYIDKAKDIPGFEAAVRFATKSRAVGLGVLGWHTFLQENKIPFDSFDAMMYNAEIFSLLQRETRTATQELAKEYGEPEWCKGFGIRNTHTIAIAPTVSNSIISGGVSAGIEPISANVFSQKSAKGTFMKYNDTLVKVLEAKGKNNIDTWKEINNESGSVQKLKCLSDEEKEVFLTAREINQYTIIKQAAQRQKFIDQGQSVNLFFFSNADPKYINGVHLEGWKTGLKGLYYCRSESVLKGDSISRQKDECKACEG